MSKLDPYKEWGFTANGTSEDEEFGDCPFCTKSNKFYLNIKSAVFDCKYCGAKGNRYSFMLQTYKKALESTTQKDYHSLEVQRGIPKEALTRFGIAKLWDYWIFPYPSESGKSLRDIRYWVKSTGKMRSTRGCSIGLYNGQRLRESKVGAKVFICEGEWDTMAMDWIINRDIEDWTGEEECVVVGVPGANIFKDEWLRLFRGHPVYILYDNDGAGISGARRVETKLDGVAKELYTLTWPAELPSGYDIRDFLRDSLEIGEDDILPTILGMCTKRVEKEDGEEEIISADGTIGKIYGVGSVPLEEIPTFEEVVEVFKANIRMSEDMITALKISLAHAYACTLPGDPLWTYLVGPPGCGKTLLLSAMQGSARCIYQSSFSPRSLVSGYRSEKDPSYLPLWNRRCVVLKDFTEILSSHPTSKDEMYGVLRGAFDGYVHRPFGNGVVREYYLRFSMLAGVTPEIHADKMALMGDRFLKYEMFRGQKWSADEQISRAIDNISGEARIEQALTECVGKILSREVGELPRVPLWVKNRIIALSQLIGALRAQVPRKGYGDETLLYRPTREVGTRIAKQIVKLGQMLALVDNAEVIQYKNYQIMERVALDTAIGFHIDLVRSLIEVCDGRADRVQLTEILDLPSTTLNRSLEDLRALGVVYVLKKKSGSKGRPMYIWHVSSWILDLWKRAKVGKRPLSKG